MVAKERVSYKQWAAQRLKMLLASLQGPARALALNRHDDDEPEQIASFLDNVIYGLEQVRDGVRERTIPEPTPESSPKKRRGKHEPKYAPSHEHSGPAALSAEDEPG